MMRYMKLAAVVAFVSLAASCGVAPPMTTYPYPKYGFTAGFPAPPKVDDTTDPQSGVRVVALDAQSLGRDFAITITEVDPARDIDGLTEDASQAMAKGVGGEVTGRTYCATAEGVLGRELVISKNGRAVVKARYYLSGARFYILTAESQLGVDNDPAVEDFLTSFHAAAVKSAVGK